MKHGIYVHTHGQLADVEKLSDLAVVAARTGWDGFFIWDQLHHDELPVVDTQIALGAIALATRGTDLKIGALITPLARRRAWKVAKELATLDQLAPNRVVGGAGIGDSTDFSIASTEPQTGKGRAAALEDGLDILRALLAGGTSWQGARDGSPSVDTGSPFLPVPENPIPIWGSAVVDRNAGEKQPKKPFRRAAAEMDGLFPIVIDEDFAPELCLTPDELAQAIEWAQAGTGEPLPGGFDVIVSGRTQMEASPVDLKGLEEAGLTWWLESMPLGITPEEANAAIEEGPPA